MRSILTRHKSLHLWLLADLLLLAAFRLLLCFPAALERFAAGSAALRQGLGRLCALVPFSVMEGLCILLVCAAILYLCVSILVIPRASRERGHRAYSALLGAVCAGLTLYLGFCALWGVHYYTTPFPEQFGLEERPVSVEELASVTAYFAQQLSESADSVPRDAQGRFAADRQEILQESVHVYDTLEERYPFLRFEDTGVKPVHFSRVMSALDFTGVYCPFTGESNVNMDAPACFLPATAAHELAHQRSIASEQACNFLAVLACTTSGNQVYAYSGWLKGYVNLNNALYGVAPEQSRAIRATLPATVLADLEENNAYWEQFHASPATAISNQVYEGFLKSYGVEEGLASYGMVVDLLVAYYAEEIP